MQNSEKKSKILEAAPAFLKDILPYISPRVFDLMDIPIVALNMGKLSYQYVFSKGVKSLSKRLEPLLPKTICFDENAKEVITKEEQGEAILELYFSQILSKEQVFLDLRPSRFQVERGKIKWVPNGLYCHFKNDFQQGLIDLYTGFYHDDDVLYERGLQAIGLIQETDSKDQRDQIKSIFKEHFGDHDQTSVKFEMKHFVDSFHQIFDHIFTEKKKLSDDFVYLGIYLVTLYLHLEKINRPLDVRASFERAFQKFNAM